MKKVAIQRGDDLLLASAFERELMQDVYRESYYEFFKDAFRVLHPGEPFNDNWHIEYICDSLQAEALRIQKREPRKKDLIINVPFRSSKSLITTVVFPIWCWLAVAPRFKFITVSYSETLALEHSQRSKDLLKSDMVQEIYGHIERLEIRKDLNSKQHWANKGGGFRKAVGTGGQITGSGADIIIIDDGQDPKRAASERERENTKDFYDHTLYSRLNQLEIGLRINIQQRLHEEDLSGHLLSKAPHKYKHICIPGELTEKTKDIVSPPELKEHYIKNLFWPTRFSAPVLEDYKLALGSQGYAGQVQQLPAPEEGGVFKRDWFEIIAPEKVQRNAVKHPIKFYLDTAETMKQENDPSAILAAFVMDNILYIVDARELYLEFYQLCRYIPKYGMENGYTEDSRIKVEPKSSGKSVVSQLKAETQLNIYELDAPRDDKLSRAKSVQPKCEAGRVKLLQGNWNKPFLDQVTVFPNAANDDMTDVLVYAIMDNLKDNQGFGLTWL